MAQTVIDIIEGIFKKCGVPYLLAGGFAVNAHGYARATFDVDLVIPEEKYSLLCEEFQKEGFKESHRSKVHGRFSGHSEFLTDVDLLFVDSKTFQGLLEAAQDKQIGRRSLKVVSLNHLIAMKLHAIKNHPENREFKDLNDIMELIKENDIDPGSGTFKNLCLKFGTEELYQKIVNFHKKK